MPAIPEALTSGVEKSGLLSTWIWKVRGPFPGTEVQVKVGV